MKLHNIILPTTAVLLGLAACSKVSEMEDSEYKAQENLVSVTLGADFLGTKTTMAANGKVLWSAGDQITVNVGDNAYVFTLASGAGTQSATFTAIVTASDAAILDGTTSGVTVTACYPSSGSAVPATQAYAENTFADGMNPMTATFANKTLSFSNDAAVVRVQNVAASATEAVLSYTVNEIAYSVTMSSLPITAAKDLYFVVVPGAQTFSLALDGSDAVAYTASAATEAGSRYNLTVAVSDVAQIGDVKYSSLESAFAAVQDDETIEVIADASITSKIYVDKNNVTLDLNNHTVTCCVSGDYSFLVDKFKKFTIQDGVFVDGTNDASLGVIHQDDTYTGEIADNAVLFNITVSNVDFGVFDAQGNCTSPFNTKNGTLIKFSHTGDTHGTPACTLTNVRAASDHGILDYEFAVNTTITNGKYIVNHSSPCPDAGCGNSVIALNMPKCVFPDINTMTDVTVIATNCNIAVAGYVNLNNCTVNCDNYALVLSNTEKMSITGGTYTGGTDAVRVQGNGGTITINSGTFTGGTNALAAYLDNTQGTTVATINVSDGTFSGNLATGDNNCNILLSGGTYSVDPSAYVASGFKAEANGTTPETWTVESSTPIYCEGVGKYSAPAILIGSTWWAPVNLGYEPANGDYKGYPYGRLYQWGRKYGQGYKDATYEDADYIGKEGGSQSITTLTTKTKLTTHPDGDSYNGIYYKVSGNWYNGTDPKVAQVWDSKGLSNSDVASHVSEKTKYDPCPAGWRVPTYNELKGLGKASSTSAANDSHGTSTVKGYYFYNGTFFLPAAGYIYSGNSGSRGSKAVYWASGQYNDGQGGSLNKSSISGSNKTYGQSIRCVKE